MGEVLACLRGWHPGLALAELEALLPEAEIEPAVSARWCRVRHSTHSARTEALALASGLQCFLLNGTTVSSSGIDASTLLLRMKAYLSEHPVDGSVAVRAWKQGEKIPGWSLSQLTKQVGGVLFSSGNEVDLATPDHVFAIVSDGPTASIAFGWMEGDGTASFSNGERRAGQRPFFKPVSLDPTLARLAVNLAAGPRSSGPVVDPMTGTGGFLIEASLSGRSVVGIDIHSEMVQGARDNLAWAHDGDTPGSAKVVRGDATRIGDAVPGDWHGKIAGFVLDPPYGRNSHGTETADALLRACLLSAHGVASPSAGFVLILPMHPPEQHTTSSLSFDQPFELLNGTWENVMRVIKETGWVLRSVHAERVHRSLGRLVVHAQRRTS